MTITDEPRSAKPERGTSARRHTTAHPRDRVGPDPGPETAAPQHEPGMSDLAPGPRRHTAIDQPGGHDRACDVKPTVPQTDSGASEWDVLGWRERLINRQRQQVQDAIADRAKRDEPPPLVIRPHRSTPAASPIEERNREHWRRLADATTRRAGSPSGGSVLAQSNPAHRRDLPDEATERIHPPSTGSTRTTQDLTDKTTHRTPPPPSDVPNETSKRPTHRQSPTSETTQRIHSPSTRTTHDPARSKNLTGNATHDAEPTSDMLGPTNRDPAHWRDLANRATSRAQPSNGFGWFADTKPPGFGPVRGNARRRDAATDTHALRAIGASGRSHPSRPEVTPSKVSATLYGPGTSTPIPSGPFSYRRPTAARAVGRYPVKPSRWRPSLSDDSLSSNAAREAAPEPNGEARHGRVPSRGTFGERCSERLHPNVSPIPFAFVAEPVAPTVNDWTFPAGPEDHPTARTHRPRRSPFRAVFRRAFRAVLRCVVGSRLARRSSPRSGSCRECRTAWPCPEIVDHVNRAFHGTSAATRQSRDRLLHRLSLPQRRPSTAGAKNS
ncbi:hypothetical protein STSO111631_23885 [Stackebrandtia soli]